jgi:hypothetical protein
MTATALRNAGLDELVTLLKSQQARKLDVVMPASSLWSRGGDILVHGVPVVMEEDGVTDPNGRYAPTSVFDSGLSAKLGIPSTYLRRLRSEGIAHVLDFNVNGLLHEYKDADGSVLRPADDRKFLVRLFTGADGTPGVARALLSDKYRMIENLDVLMAALDGVNQTGAQVEIQGADLTDSRMYVRIAAPGIQALAPELLKDYRSPFTGNRGADNPVVFAGFVISNSETGGGAFTVTPRITFQVCTNGMTVTTDAMRSVHLGGRQDDGIVNWSERTNKLSLDLVRSKTADMVRTCLNKDYMESVIRKATEKAGKPVNKPVEEIKVVGKALGYTQAEQDGILSHFIKGSDLTAGGLMNAVTSWAQEVDDADRASELEDSALRVLTAVR